MKLHHRLILAALGFVLFTGIVYSGDDEEQKGPKKLTVYPALMPEHKLRYRLLPAVSELEPGNAASLYRRAFIDFASKPYSGEAEQKHFREWFDKPLAELKNNKYFSSALFDLERGARKSYVDWDLIPEIRKEGALGVRTPESISLWTATDNLIFRSRISLAEGKFDESLGNYQTALALSRHLAHKTNGFFVVMALGLSDRTANEVEMFIQQLNAPNLYWAIHVLPKPLFSLHESLELDLYGHDRFIPQVEKLEKQILTEDEAQQLFKEYLTILDRFTALRDSSETPVTEARLAAGKIMQKTYLEKNEKILRRAGRSEGDIKKMTAAQVFLLAALYQCRWSVDEMAALSHSPYDQSIPKTEALSNELKKQARDNTTLALAALLTPSTSVYLSTEGRVERHWAMLETIEALRLYAAEHGDFPNSLDDCTVNTPHDPLSGKAFIYHKDASQVVLRAPATPFLAERLKKDLVYELRLQAKGK